MAREEIVNVNNVSRISAGTVCVGTIHSKYDIRIDGTFEGQMHSKGRIVVGESAIIKGDVICDNIDLWGKLTGTVYTKDTLSLKSGCCVNGAINVRRFMVELGSEFNGTCRMITEEDYDKKVNEIETAFTPASSKAPAAPAKGADTSAKGTEFDGPAAASGKADAPQQSAGKR